MYVVRIYWSDGRSTEEFKYYTLYDAVRASERLKYAYGSLVRKVVIV